MPYRALIGALRLTQCACGAPADMVDTEDKQVYCGCCYADRNPTCTACGTENDVNRDTSLCTSCTVKGY